MWSESATDTDRPPVPSVPWNHEIVTLADLVATMLDHARDNAYPESFALLNLRDMTSVAAC